ncbi:alcohol dehydrogenase catalytic domain-containing protein [Microbacterium sp. NPDC076911]|uniref:zinc-dependent alcohol dehydrogenase n=1 Tax=Microbacterium sp. NPDC076911 TaxID=3154958 RepID=UPI0034313004
MPEQLMTAVSVRGPGDMTWERIARPTRGAGQLLVRVERLGVCGTDVHLLDGTMGYIAEGLTTYPFQPGHEWCGVVVECDGPERAGEIRDADSAVRVGDRVVGEPFLSCGTCDLCRAGHRDQCLARDEMGVRGESAGAAAEYIVVPRENVVVVPSHVDATAAVLAEPLVTALHALSVVHTSPGESLGIVGAGTLGLLAAQVASASGVRVTLYARGDRAKRAASVGADFVFVDQAEESAHDAVLEMSGGGGAFEFCLRVVKPTGRVALVGVASTRQPVDTSLVVTKGITIAGVLGGIRFLPHAMHLIAAGIVRADAIVDDILPFAQYSEAIARVAGGAMMRPKVLLDLSERSADAAQ